MHGADDYEDDFPPDPDEYGEEQGFGFMPEEDLTDQQTASILDPPTMYRLLCGLAERIVALIKAKSVHKRFHLIVLEDLEGRLVHMKKVYPAVWKGLPDELQFPVGMLPETGTPEDRQLNTTDIVCDPGSFPLSTYELVEFIANPNGTPLASYYVETSRK